MINVARVLGNIIRDFSNSLPSLGDVWREMAGTEDGRVASRGSTELMSVPRADSLLNWANIEGFEM